MTSNKMDVLPNSILKSLAVLIVSSNLLTACSSGDSGAFVSDQDNAPTITGSTTGSETDNAGGSTDGSNGNTTGGSGTDSNPGSTTDPATDPATDTGGDGNTDEQQTPTASNEKPNILLIITDDQGIDASAQYSLSNDLPNTPVINELAASGITYENAWATPSCTTTRAATLSGKHGVNNGVPRTPGILDPQVGTIQSFLSSQAASSVYATGVFGKWHVAGGNPDPNHPASLGIDHYAGNLMGNLDDFFSWDMTVNGVSQENPVYHTTALVDMTIDWIADQANMGTPWFAWVAFSAPHSPFHAPPAEFNTRGLSGTAEDIDNNKRDYFLSAIETIDTEVGRLLDSLEAEERERTLIIYVGDNGSPRAVIDRNAYIAASHGKGSLFEGGVQVPLVISGHGVTRSNVREPGLVHVVDFFPTIAELAGAGTVSGRDGYSLLSSFSAPNAISRENNYTEYYSDDPLGSGWTVRSNDFKYLAYEDGTEALYGLQNDPDEASNLLPGDSSAQGVVESLKKFGQSVRGESTTTEPLGVIDITNQWLVNGSPVCADYANAYVAMALDVNSGDSYSATLDVTTNTTHCVLRSNAIPNHDFNNGSDSFPNPVSEQSSEFLIPLVPTIANQTTPLTLGYDDAILLNGVKVDLLAAACFGVGNGKVGCNDDAQAWRYDPMYLGNGFRVDQHNAHTQPDGAYHYHGTPNALFDDSTAVESPVIGFAADGFPIYGSYFNDNGTIRKVQSSFQLKAGARPIGTDSPGGQYDGTYRDDYEYVENSGDLDACNGMLLNGNYAYFVSEGFPYMMACFKGTVDESFNKQSQ